VLITDRNKKALSGFSGYVLAGALPFTQPVIVSARHLSTGLDILLNCLSVSFKNDILKFSARHFVNCFCS
jgi:hypothetical protein